MNDFTKEELKWLYALVTGQPGSLTFANEDIAVLGNNLRYMIEDYCDHTWKNMCCECATDSIVCTKCEITSETTKGVVK